MDVGVERGEAGNGDVLCKEVEFGDSVPDLAFGWELDIEGQSKLWAPVGALRLTMLMMRTLGEIGHFFPSLFSAFLAFNTRAGVATAVVINSDAASSVRMQLARYIAQKARQSREPNESVKADCATISGVGGWIERQLPRAGGAPNKRVRPAACRLQSGNTEGTPFCLVFLSRLCSKMQVLEISLSRSQLPYWF